MKIKLTNFRCHIDGQYEFPDTGLVLLSGDSGSGKSTLLKAILYALYGTRAVRKPYTFGTTKCSVSLEFLGMKIKRTNRPNRLIVDDLEDDVAQEFINENMLSLDEFMISSYIPQKNNNSILSIAQTEQLRLIKTLSFENTQNELYREKITILIRESSHMLVEKRANEQFIQQELERIECKVVDFPLALCDSETKDKAISRYRKRVRLFNQRITTLLEKQVVLNEQSLTQTTLESDLVTTNKKLVKKTNKIDKLSVHCQQLRETVIYVPTDLEENIDCIKLNIQYIKTYNERVLLQIQFDQIHADKKLEHKLQEEQVKHELWIYKNELKDHDVALEEIAKYSTELQLWEQYLKATKRLSQVQKRFELQDLNVDELIEQHGKLLDRVNSESTRLYRQKDKLTEQAEFEKKRVNCPECNASLYWQNKALISIESLQEKRDYDSEISILDQQLSQLNDNKDKTSTILCKLRDISFPVLRTIDPDVYEQMREHLNELPIFIAQNLQRSKTLANLEREETANYLTPVLNKIKRQITIKTKVLKGLAVKAVPTEDIKELQQKLHQLEIQSEQYQKHTTDLQECMTKINDTKSKRNDYIDNVKELEQFLMDINITQIIKSSSDVAQKIKDLKKQQEEDSELADQIEQYITFRRLRKDIKRWEKQLVDIIKELKHTEKVHTANLILKEKFIQAEIMALESTIASINEHTSYYLDTFFSEHQLSVILEASYKGKKMKTLKINTSISYKGNEYDTITQLSGGEFDRCTLASICGINSMLGSPILILDESLSSLDSNVNTEILRFLEQLAQEKLILICSHEAVQGIFNATVSL